MRLIDADALMEKYHKTAVWDSWIEIEAAPTVDAVPVVRCEDCKWYEKGKSYTPYCNNVKNLFEEMKADDYCSYGERKEE